jgi:exodeoxyribonuclease VII large subunit
MPPVAAPPMSLRASRGVSLDSGSPSAPRTAATSVARISQSACKAAATALALARGATRAHADAAALDRSRAAAHARRAATLERLRLALAAHDPQRTLERGYALVEDAAGEPVTSASGARTQPVLGLRMHDGRLLVRPEPHVP